VLLGFFAIPKCKYYLHMRIFANMLVSFSGS
jgi:hypothetical protein